MTIRNIIMKMSGIGVFPSLIKSLIFTAYLVPAISGLARAEVSIPCDIDDLQCIPHAAEETLGVADEENGLLISDLGGGLFVASELAGQVYQSMFLVTPGGVIMVDAPPSLMNTDAQALSTNLLGAISKVSYGRPVTHLIYSHTHTDHIGGAGSVVSAFPHVKIIAHRDAKQELVKANDSRRPVPDDAFRHKKVLNIGGKRLVLQYRGSYHGKGDIFIYAPYHRALMVVDVVFPNWVPFANLGLTADVRGYIDIHQKIIDEYHDKVDYFIGGHLTRVGTIDDVRRSQDYVKAVQRAAGLALVEVSTGNPTNDFDGFPYDYFQFGPSPYNVINHFFGDVVDSCADKILSGEFGDFSDLGGLKIFTNSNCYSMLNYIRLNADSTGQ